MRCGSRRRPAKVSPTTVASVSPPPTPATVRRTTSHPAEEASRPPETPTALRRWARNRSCHKSRSRPRTARRRITSDRSVRPRTHAQSRGGMIRELAVGRQRIGQHDLAPAAQQLERSGMERPRATEAQPFRAGLVRASSISSHAHCLSISAWKAATTSGCFLRCLKRPCERTHSTAGFTCAGR